MRIVRSSCLLTVAAVVLLAVPALAADRLTLTNGDTLTGEVHSVSDHDVVFTSDLAGTITVKRSAIMQVVRRGADGRTETLSAAQLAPTPSGAGADAGWNGETNGDVAISRGNTETATISINGTAARLTHDDKLDAYGNLLLSTVGGGTGATIARSVRTGARYDRDIARPVFGFGFGDVEHDLLQLLDLRTVIGGGAGVHVANASRVQANVFGGVSYAHDKYSPALDQTSTTSTSTTTTSTTTTTTVTTPGNSANANGKGLAVGRNRTIVVQGGTPPPVVNPTLARNVGEYVMGQDVVAELGDRVTLTQRFAVFPAMNNPSDYRISFDLSLGGQITEHWQWHTDVSDRYLRIPPSGGAVRNDLFFATGLGVTFGNGDVGGYRGADTRPAP